MTLTGGSYTCLDGRPPRSAGRCWASASVSSLASQLPLLRCRHPWGTGGQVARTQLGLKWLFLTFDHVLSTTLCCQHPLKSTEARRPGGEEERSPRHRQAGCPMCLGNRAGSQDAGPTALPMLGGGPPLPSHGPQLAAARSLLGINLHRGGAPQWGADMLAAPITEGPTLHQGGHSLVPRCAQVSCPEKTFAAELSSCVDAGRGGGEGS